MKHILLLAVSLLALGGCSILRPVAKFLAIPVAKYVLSDSDDSDGDTEDEEDQR